MTALGGDFKKARESRSFAISDVARQLHIRSEFLEAIESERWEMIGDPVSIRGLLRTYARFLGLDGGLMVSRFNTEHGVAAAPAPPIPSASGVDAKSLLAIIGGVIAIIVVFYSLSQFVARARLHRDGAPVPSLTATTKMIHGVGKKVAPRPNVSTTLDSMPLLVPTPLPTASPL